MTTKTEYLAENAKWTGERAASALEQVPDAHWDAVLAATQEFGGTDPGIDCDVVVTRETLADFDAARAEHWSERGSRSEHAIEGLSALKFERFQLARGKTRQGCMIVIDLGDIRLALV